MLRLIVHRSRFYAQDKGGWDWKLKFTCIVGTNVAHYKDCVSQIAQRGQLDSSLCWPKGSMGRGEREGERKREK